MPDSTVPLLNDKVKDGENDGVDIIEDENVSKFRSNSWLSSVSTKTQDKRPVDKVF